MYPPTYEQFCSFLNSNWASTRYIEFRIHGRLVATAVTDLLTVGVSAIYTFFDPDEARRSLGTYSVMHQVAWAQHLGLRYVYLGYWIANCKKMTYKSQFRPLELRQGKCWSLKLN